MLQTRKIVKNKDGSYLAVFGQGNANMISGADAIIRKTIINFKIFKRS